MCRSSLLATYCLRWRCTDASIHPHSYVRRVLEPRRSAQMSPILRASCSMISELWDPKGSSKGVAARPGGLLCSSAECRLGGNGVPDILRALIDMCGASKRLGFGVSPRRRTKLSMTVTRKPRLADGLRPPPTNALQGFGGQIWQTRSWDGCGTHRFVWYFCRARERLDIQTRSGLPERQHGNHSHGAKWLERDTAWPISHRRTPTRLSLCPQC